jgi:hypothetical protein
MTISQESITHISEMNNTDNKRTEMIASPDGWFLVSVSALMADHGAIGSVSVGKLIDARALSEMNFDRPDPLIGLLDDDSEVVAASLLSSAGSNEISIAPDREYVEAAESGVTLIGSANIGGKELPTAYVPVIFGTGHTAYSRSC